MARRFTIDQTFLERKKAVNIFVVVRALIYAAVFIGFVLVYLPGRFLSWSGIVRLTVIAAPQVTAHPLGGCPMGEDGSHGVVDHFGKVFRDDTQAVHDGLYVADGSIIRSALEVNPFLTISALTERIVENILVSLTH
jgi:choline dehydrogenase-like flavoprotein